MKNISTHVKKNTGIRTDAVIPHLTAGALFLGVSFFPLLLGADCTSGSPTTICNPLGQTTDIATFFARILQIVIVLGSSVVVFFIIFAGFKYVTARGDETKVKEATQALTWTAVGAAVLLGAQVIQVVISNTVIQLGAR